MEQELLKPQQENINLKWKLAKAKKQHEPNLARLSPLKCLTSVAKINFYTGLPNYAIFLAPHLFRSYLVSHLFIFIVLLSKAQIPASTKYIGYIM